MTSFKRVFVAMSLALSLLAMPFATASAHADQNDVITCQQASVTVTEGMSHVIPNILHLAQCASTEGETLTLSSASCTTAPQYPQYKQCYGDVQTWSNGKVKINMGGAYRAKEHDWLLGFQTKDADDTAGWTSVNGYVVVHVRLYQVPTVTRPNASHITVHNPNSRVVDSRPLTIHIITKKSGHCTWYANQYNLPPSSTSHITLPKAVWGKKSLMYWINSGNAGPEVSQIQVATSPALRQAEKTC